jgi:hypothetical protein
VAAVGQCRQFRRATITALRELAADQRDRVRAQGEAGAGVIGAGVFDRARWRDRIPALDDALRARMGESGRSRAETEFSYDVLAARLASALGIVG